MSFSAKHQKSVRWNSLATVVIAFGQVALLIVLTRFSTKADFGFMALVQTLNALSFFLLDAGLSNALMVEDGLSAAQFNGLWRLFSSIGLFIGISLCGIGFCITENATQFALFSLSGLNIAVQGFGLLQKTQLRRNLRFDRLASIECLSFLAGAVLTMLLALLHWGVFAMLWGLIFTNFLSGLACVLSERSPEPRPGEKLSDAWDFIWEKRNFGLYQIADRLISLVHGRADTVLIGYSLGVDALGVYDVVKQLFSRFTGLLSTALSPVFLSSMGRVKSDKSMLREHYYSLIGKVSLLSFSALGLAFVLAEYICELILGAQWVGAVFLLRCTAITFLFRSSGMFSMLPSMSRGNGKLGAYWNSFHALLSVLFLALALKWQSIEAVGLTLLLIQILLFYPNFLYLLKSELDAAFWTYLLVFRAPLLIAMSSCFVASLAHVFLPELNWLNFSLLSAAGLCAFIASTVVFQRNILVNN